MMVLANYKKKDLLEQERTYLNTLDLRLFKNDYNPVGGMVTADFTEVNCAGYAPENNVGFTAAYLNGLNQAQLDAPAVTFNVTNAAGNFWIYGYYFTDPNDGNKVVFAERDPDPFLVDGANRTYTVVPKKVQDTM